MASKKTRNSGGDNYENALVRLGAITSIDVTRLAPTTLSSIMSHVRTLQRNNVEISRESLGNDPIAVLNSLRDTKGQLLASDYKRQIGMTIKRLYPDLQFSLRQYKVESYNAETRRANPKYLVVARSLLLRAAKTLALIDENREGNIDEQLSVYDTCIAILITSCTSLRIHEIYDLQMSHIGQIRRLESIFLRSKGGKNLRNIVPNSLLLRVFGIIENNRERCVRGLQEARARTAVRAHYADRVRDNYIILSSIDFMRKRLRELAASTKDATLNLGARSLGFNMFRNFVSSILADGGGHEIARSLNNHSDVNTTLDHYTVVGPNAAEATFEKLERLMNKVSNVRSAELPDDDDKAVNDDASPRPLESRPRSSEPLSRPRSSEPLSRPRQKQPSQSHPYETPMAQEGDRLYDISK